MPFAPDLQVIILAAGRGSRMPELFSDRPKCLLPIGPKPLIWYTLRTVQSLGYKQCIMVVFNDQKLEIQDNVNKFGLKMTVIFHTIPCDEDYGTADSLRSIHSHINSDVLVLPCDLITNMNLAPLITKFRSLEASLVNLYLLPHSIEGLFVPGPKPKDEEEVDIVMLNEDDNRLVLLASTSDFETHFTTQRALHVKYPRITSHTDLIDAHVYIMKKWTIDYLKTQPTISSLRGEFLPRLVKKHFMNLKSNDEILKHCNQNNKKDLYPRFPDDKIRIFAHIAQEEDLGVRVNNLASFVYMNSNISEIWNKIAPTETLLFTSPKAMIESTQVDEKCVIWDNATLHDKTSFKNSIIGPNVEVSSLSRIFNCILMKNVKIEERVALDNCIIGDNTVIESKTHLTLCVVGCKQTVPEGSKHSRQILAN